MHGRARVPLSLKKRFLFAVLMGALTYLAVELISFAAIGYLHGGWTAVQRVAEGDAGPDFLGSGFDYPDEIVHPYLGWVRRPHPHTATAEPDLVVNDFGFSGQDLPLQTRSPDKVIIGILGGSVAEQFVAGASGKLVDELQQSPFFAGKEAVIVRLAQSGYKQPQQLLTVNYLLTLGAEFDILINIDGYNEIVLPVVENVPNHVYAGFPRSWHLRVTEAGNLEVMRTIGRIAQLKDQARSWAEIVRRRPWCYSPTLNLAWRLYHSNVRLALFREYSHLHRQKYEEQDAAASGPPQKFSGDADLYEHCAAIWMRSSLQLHHLCAANGIRYYHFLQPNQYVPGSKTMRGREMTDAWQPNHRGKKPVEQGYPLLIREGRNLVGLGVSFTDLTRLFADHPEQTYCDWCCHLNAHGNELMAQEIAEVIRSSFARQ
ncbi:MAG: hypothetical protein ACM3U2_12340 [Deltaproteobacteria bacterium]